MNDKQKQAAVPSLQKNAVPKLVDSRGPGVRNRHVPSGRDASSVRRLREVLHDTTEIKDLTTFYKSPTGRKFIQVQDQVGRDVVNGLMQKYMPQAIKATRTKPTRKWRRSSRAK